MLIDFIESDIDRPVCIGRLYNASQTPPALSQAGSLPNNKTLSGIKTKTYQGNGYNELLFDDTPKEERTKLSTEHAKTQFNIGYLVHPRTEGKAPPRGEGFELRTDAWAAIRAGAGLLISTDARSSASSTHLDGTEATQQLQASLNQSKAQSDLASQHHAEALNTNSSSEHLLKVAQSTHTQSGSTGVTHDVPAYSKPIINISSPAGIIHATPKSQTMANGQDLHLIQGQDINIATGRNMAVSIGQSLSMFVAGVDSKTKQAVSSAMKLFAAKGKVEIQAHSDNIELTAAKDVKLLSTLQNIDFAAAKSITITAGGAYIKLEGGNIDVHAPGKVSVKGALKTFDGPASMGYVFPEMPGMPNIDIGSFDEQFHLVHAGTDQPIPHTKYRITTSEGKIFEGVSDENGYTKRIFTNKTATMEIEILDSDDEHVVGDM